MMTKTLLLTGFEPFLDNPINPSQSVVQRLHGEQIGAYQIESRTLPVEFERSGEVLLNYVKEIKPDAVICLGLAAGRDRVTPERVAINCNDGETDNSGKHYVDAPIHVDGPAAYFSTLPIRSMVELLHSKGLPAGISNSAGTYLCNNVMYQVLRYADVHGLNLPAGFIHIPASHELAVTLKRSVPSWSLDSITDAIRLCKDHEKQLRDFMRAEGVNLPSVTEPKPLTDAADIPPGVKLTNEEIANGLALKIIALSQQAALGATQSVRTDIGSMWMQFLNETLIYGSTLKVKMRKRGWAKLPPAYSPPGT